MVFYTCSGCGESLKKNKVENHCYSCHACEYLTCIDCNTDFYGNDYKYHTQCITENEKYSAKGTEFKPNKGDVKQQEWLKNIDIVMSSEKILSRKALNLMENLKHYENIPRKKTKFLNFLKNSLNIYDQTLGEEIYAAFSSASLTTVKTPTNRCSSTDSQSVEKPEKDSNNDESTRTEENPEEKSKNQTFDHDELPTIPEKLHKKVKKDKSKKCDSDVIETDNTKGQSHKKKKKSKVHEHESPGTNSTSIDSTSQADEAGGKCREKKRKSPNINGPDAVAESDAEVKIRKKKRKLKGSGVSDAISRTCKTDQSFENKLSVSDDITTEKNKRGADQETSNETNGNDAEPEHSVSKTPVCEKKKHNISVSGESCDTRKKKKKRKKSKCDSSPTVALEMDSGVISESNSGPAKVKKAKKRKHGESHNSKLEKHVKKLKQVED